MISNETSLVLAVMQLYLISQTVLAIVITRGDYNFLIMTGQMSD